MTLIGILPFCHDGREQEPHWVGATVPRLSGFVKFFSITWWHQLPKPFHLLNVHRTLETPHPAVTPELQLVIDTRSTSRLR